MLIESSKPLRVRLRSGEVHLIPGKPTEFTEEDGLRLLSKAKGKVRLITPAIEIGAQITWTRGSLSIHGTVDFVHLDEDGIVWAFVSCGESWAAVNMKFVTRSGDA